MSHLLSQASKIPSLASRVVMVDSIRSYQDYNLFLKVGMTDHFDTDFVLHIEPDSAIVDPSAWSDEFFDYDYIGAPWSLSWLETGHDGAKCRDDLVGNSGFCLMSKRLCEAVKPIYYELPDSQRGKLADKFICTQIKDRLKEAGMRFAPYEVANRFSVERAPYDGQFGAHKWIMHNGRRIPPRDFFRRFLQPQKTTPTNK